NRPPNQPPARDRQEVPVTVKIIRLMVVLPLPSWIPSRMAPAPRPTHSPCLRPLAVVAPARLLPRKIARAQISRVTSCACKCELMASLPSEASRTKLRMTLAHNEPPTATTMPKNTRAQATGPAKGEGFSGPPIFNPGLRSGLGTASVGSGFQMRQPIRPPRPPQADNNIGCP